MTMYDHKKGISSHHLNEIVGSLDIPLGIDAVFFVEYILTYLPVLESDMTPAYWISQLRASLHHSCAAVMGLPLILLSCSFSLTSYLLPLG